MMFKRNEKDADDFWQELEQETGEKVLARSLGQYISGWEDFDNRGWGKIWGLFIATSGGFRFHHFPQYSWIDAVVNVSGRRGSGPKERTFFIPMEKIISVRLNKETGWWKKIFSSSPPKLIIHYLDNTGDECRLLMEAEYKSDDLVETLSREIE